MCKFINQSYKVIATTSWGLRNLHIQRKPRSLFPEVCAMLCVLQALNCGVCVCVCVFVCLCVWRGCSKYPGVLAKTSVCVHGGNSGKQVSGLKHLCVCVCVCVCVLSVCVSQPGPAVSLNHRSPLPVTTLRVSAICIGCQNIFCQTQYQLTLSPWHTVVIQLLSTLSFVGHIYSLWHSFKPQYLNNRTIS